MTLSITKSYANGDYLYAVDLDNIVDPITTLLNTTKLDSTYIQAGGVSLANLVTAVQNALVPAGTILPTGCAAAPTGYLLCDGSAVDRTTYAALYAAVGDAFGEGDGSTTFHLPDLRGRFLRGADGSAGNDPDAATRTAMNTGGNTGDNVGSVQADATAKNGLTASASTSSVTGTTNTDTHSHTSNAADANGTNTGSGKIGDSNDYWGVSTATINNDSHSHTVTGTAAAQTITVGAGDNETRPLNAYVNYMIKY